MTHQFAYLAAMPDTYIQAATEHTQVHGDGYFLAPATPSITIMHISADEALMLNFGRHNIVQCLLNNRILVVWLTHTYLYGVQYLCQHLAVQDSLRDEYHAVEEEWISHV